MPATPAIIARYTVDGIALTYRNDVLKAAQPNAVDADEVPTFFRYQADALAMLNERASLLGGIGKLHEAIEVSSALGIGTSIAVTPIVPSIRVIDASREIDAIGRVRSVSFDMSRNDRYSVELVG